jgi:hypothetical protein
MVIDSTKAQRHSEWSRVAMTSLFQRATAESIEPCLIRKDPR